jgi:hypothetical protein
LEESFHKKIDKPEWMDYEPKFDVPPKWFDSFI